MQMRAINSCDPWVTDGLARGWRIPNSLYRVSFFYLFLACALSKDRLAIAIRSLKDRSVTIVSLTRWCHVWLVFGLLIGRRPQ